MKITKVKPTDSILKWRPEVKYKAEITTQEAKETEWPDGTTAMIARSVTGYGVTKESAIKEADNIINRKFKRIGKN